MNLLNKTPEDSQRPHGNKLPTNDEVPLIRQYEDVTDHACGSLFAVANELIRQSVAQQATTARLAALATERHEAVAVEDISFASTPRYDALMSNQGEAV